MAFRKALNDPKQSKPARETMRLLFFTPAFLPIYGGLERFLHDLAKDLIGHGDQVELLTWRQRADMAPEECLDGILVRRFDRPSSLLAHIDTLTGPDSPDLALVAEPYGKHIAVSRRIRRRLRIPVILNLLGTASETSNRLVRWLNSVYATRIIACSAYAASMFGFGAGRTSVIPHGIPEQTLRGRFTPVTDTLHVLCTCRITRRKGLETLLQAAALTPDVRYVVVGDTQVDPVYHRELESLAGDLHLANLQFTGKVDESELRDRYHEANLFVLPTRHEMFGIVYIEAMAAGLPVVSTDCTAVPEVVTPETGYLVAPGDAKALAERILRFRDPEHHAAFARAALARAEGYSFSSTAAQYREEFARLVPGS